MEYKLLHELPDVPVGSVYKPAAKEGWYYTEAVNVKHRMRSLPFYLVEMKRDWFEEVRG